MPMTVSCCPALMSYIYLVTSVGSQAYSGNECMPSACRLYLLPELSCWLVVESNKNAIMSAVLT